MLAGEGQVRRPILPVIYKHCSTCQRRQIHAGLTKVRLLCLAAKAAAAAAGACAPAAILLLPTFRKQVRLAECWALISHHLLQITSQTQC